MRWTLSWRADPEARALADEHYNRQKKGSKQFVPPGRCLVLKVRPGKAFWITSYPIAEYVQHAWAGAWVCSAFRNARARRDGCVPEGDLASELVREAVAATRWRWAPPNVGAWKITRRHDRTDIQRIEIAMVTFVDRAEVASKRDPGRCFRRAGFVEIGRTKAGLVALGLPVELVPAPEQPLGVVEQLSLL